MTPCVKDVIVPQFSLFGMDSKSSMHGMQFEKTGPQKQTRSSVGIDELEERVGSLCSSEGNRNKQSVKCLDEAGS